MTSGLVATPTRIVFHSDVRPQTHLHKEKQQDEGGQAGGRAKNNVGKKKTNNELVGNENENMKQTQNLMSQTLDKVSWKPKHKTL